MIHFECFKARGTQPIIATGEIRCGKINLNMSSIWTKLIQEAGRFCDGYASDIILDIDTARQCIAEMKTTTLYLGFRDMGVDDNKYIKCRTLLEMREYRAIWKLNLEFMDDDYYDARVVATLQQVHYSYSDHEWLELGIKIK